FLRSYFRGVGEEDLASRAPAALANSARSHLEFGMERKATQSLVRVFNPDLRRDGFESPHTIVQIVTDDRPFLVDSVGLIFGRAGLAVHLVVHPVLDVRRDRRGRISGFGANGTQIHRIESWEMYEIDRQTDPEALRRLCRDIEATLEDVRVSVDDWDLMRERARSIVADLERNPLPVPVEEIGEARQLLEWM
ncbi:Bacterial NAD-glutamate dehydrogenase, partial [mine drainage metagenome]